MAKVIEILEEYVLLSVCRQFLNLIKVYDADSQESPLLLTDFPWTLSSVRRSLFCGIRFDCMKYLKEGEVDEGIIKGESIQPTRQR